jgi:hypothetical protein
VTRAIRIVLTTPIYEFATHRVEFASHTMADYPPPSPMRLVGNLWDFDGTTRLSRVNRQSWGPTLGCSLAIRRISLERWKGAAETDIEAPDRSGLPIMGHLRDFVQEFAEVVFTGSKAARRRQPNSSTSRCTLRSLSPTIMANGIIKDWRMN